MANCACCGEREADTKVGRFAAQPGRLFEWLEDVPFASACYMEHGDGLAARIRARRAKPAMTIKPEPYVLPASNLPVVTDIHCPRGHRPTIGGVTYMNPLDFADLEKQMRPTVAPPCRACASPATHGKWCVYCAERCAENRGDDFMNPGQTAEFDDWTENKDARARLAAFDRKNAPKPTADSKMLALPHPWRCDEGEP